MIFFIKKTEDGKWHWRLKSKSTGADVARCTAPETSKTQCLAVIEKIRLGAREAVIRDDPAMEESTA